MQHHSPKLNVKELIRSGFLVLYEENGAILPFVVALQGREVARLGTHHEGVFAFMDEEKQLTDDRPGSLKMRGFTE